ncbi:hypothetical protein ACFC26_14950 [Kitasatospora purpeofusca]|uniref:hypothetical protein n=1 Tax=Kitasatospora purpeofusca TaxID=67352 RepID=UPI0035E294D9
MHLQTLDGPLARQALAGEAAEQLVRAGYEVELDPELRISDAGEQALELLGGISEQIGQLRHLLEEMDDFHDLLDTAAQMVTGPYNPIHALEDLFQRAGERARPIPGAVADALATWCDTSAQHMAAIASAADAVACTPRVGAPADRRHAATAGSATCAARTGSPHPALAAPGTPLLHTTRRTT